MLSLAIVADELPDELARRESLLKKIRQAREALEQQALEKAAKHVEQLETVGRTPRTNPKEAVPKLKV